MSESCTTEDWCEENREFLGTKGIPLPEKLSQLRQKLYMKAKQEPGFRFYALYDRLYRLDVLETACMIARSRNGAPGVDGKTFKMIIEEGVETFLKDLHESLKKKTYSPSRVKRVYIPKANGGMRPLGIPTIRDRVVQTALLLIIEPIFEADFLDSSYGFRPERSAWDALKEIRKNINEGRTEIYDADLRSYFDTIPHEKLMNCLRKRIVDRSVLGLIRKWLEAPIEDRDDQGRKRVHRPDKGTPQGGVISPLLANLYLHWFEKIFNGANGPGYWANARIIRYADDFVIMAKHVGKRIVEYAESRLEGRFGLQVNREKTRCVKLCEEGSSFNFLGYTFGYSKDMHGRNRKYLNIEPSVKSQQRERNTIREMTSSKMCFESVGEMILRINLQTKGWANYFKFGYPRKAFRRINRYVQCCLISHLKRRSQRPMRPPKGVSYYSHLHNLGLMPL